MCCACPKPKRSRGREKLLARVGLAEKADVYPAFMSGGQQQRAAIARALAIEPRAMLFDEPTSALDPELVGEVLNVIRDLAAEGRTMILVTHEMKFAREVASHVIYLHNGVIEEEGPPESAVRRTEIRTPATVSKIRRLDPETKPTGEDDPMKKNTSDACSPRLPLAPPQWPSRSRSASPPNPIRPLPRLMRRAIGSAGKLT